MAEIVGGLFGVSPEQLMRQRQTTDTSNAFRFAQLSPMERAQMSIYQGGAGVGRGVQGLFGGDPELERVSQIKQLSSQFDLTTPQGARQFAQALQPFAPQEAMMAVREAERMEQSGLTRQKTTADIAIQERKVTQDEKLREALANLPEDATEAQYLQVFRQFGSPDQQAAALERARTGRERLEDAKLRRAEIAAAKGATPAKPLAASLQKSEDKDIEAIDTYLAQGEALKPSILNLTPDAKGVRTLELGPAKNAKYIAQNALGNSTPESRAYEALKSAVDTAVNLQVSAEKGVQTDKDVLRFANALIAAYGRNDTNATLEALKRYNESLDKAKTRTEARVDQRRVSQKVEPLFGGQQRPAPAQQEKPATAKTRTLKSGVVVTIED